VAVPKRIDLDNHCLILSYTITLSRFGENRHLTEFCLQQKDDPERVAL